MSETSGDRCRVEFYSPDGLVAVVNCSIVPAVGSWISIRQCAWEVVAVSYALDYAEDEMLRAMRANVEIVAAEENDDE